MKKEIKPTETTAIPKVPVQLPRKDFPKTAILLIVILLVGISGVYAGMQIGKKQMSGGLIPKITPTLVPQPDETSPQTTDKITNWKTYTNAEIGYSIKYPPEGFVGCVQPDGFYLDVGIDQQACDSGEGPSFLTIVNNLQGKNYFDKSSNEDCYTVQATKIKFAGIDATKYTNIIKSDQGICAVHSYDIKYSKYIVFNYKGQLHYIYYLDYEKVELRNQILSTFKFLN